MNLNDESLTKFMGTFFGYGNLNSDIWMIGMEEGGGNSYEEINSRIEYWEEGGEKEVEDIVKYHEKFGMGHFFSDLPKNQPTWNKLIRVLLAYENIDTCLLNVKSFQRLKLAREQSNNCLLELFPLPSPSTGHWLYSSLSKITWLSSRKNYKAYIITQRIASIKDKIRKHSPKLVIFYGNNSEYRNYWTAIADTEFKEILIEGKNAFTAKKNGIRFFIVNHPVSTGITNEYFHKIGKTARELC